MSNTFKDIVNDLIRLNELASPPTLEFWNEGDVYGVFCSYCGRVIIEHRPPVHEKALTEKELETVRKHHETCEKRPSRGQLEELEKKLQQLRSAILMVGKLEWVDEPGVWTVRIYDNTVAVTYNNAYNDIVDDVSKKKEAKS